MIIGGIPTIDEKGFYTVGQTCEILRIHRNTLAKYTEQGLIRYKLGKGARRKYYSGREILRLCNYKR